MTATLPGDGRGCRDCGGDLGGRRSDRCKGCARLRRRARTKVASHRHYLHNRERVLAGARAWERRHPEETRAMRRRARARDAGRAAALRRARRAAVIVEPYLAADIYERDGWRCGICGVPVDPRAPLNCGADPTIDHVVPISRGGADAPWNVRLAHRLCNLRKGARLDGPGAAP